MSGGGPVLWVEVSDRDELDAARRSGAAAVMVVSSTSTLYGRPGDQLCIRIGERDARVPPGQLAARLPVRAGILFRPTPDTDELVADLARRRRPLAADIRSQAEARRALDSGATALVVHDPVLVRALRDELSGMGAAGTGPAKAVPIIGVAAGSDAVNEMLGAGAQGLLVRAAELPALLAMPAFAALTAPCAARRAQRKRRRDSRLGSTRRDHRRGTRSRGSLIRTARSTRPRSALAAPDVRRAGGGGQERGAGAARAGRHARRARGRLGAQRP